MTKSMGGSGRRPSLTGTRGSSAFRSRSWIRSSRLLSWIFPLA
jgi:hypothetical protein